MIDIVLINLMFLLPAQVYNKGQWRIAIIAIWIRYACARMRYLLCSIVAAQWRPPGLTSSHLSYCKCHYRWKIIVIVTFNGYCRQQITLVIQLRIVALAGFLRITSMFIKQRREHPRGYVISDILKAKLNSNVILIWLHCVTTCSQDWYRL